MDVPSVRRVCVFAHYDPDGMVASHVLYYLRALRACVDSLLVVSTAELGEEQQAAVRALDVQLLCRENVGHDFCSYRHGIDALDFAAVDELLLCNDSVYGPFRPLEEVFERAGELPAPLLGLTASTEVAPHLQSYFLLFRKPLLASDDF